MNDRNRDRRRIERLAKLLDSSIPIPGTDLRIGLDPVLGLVPGVGDLLTTLASGYIIAVAARLGVPRSVLLKMTWNVLVDGVLGAFPLLGDLFDAAWKANERNLRLLRDYSREPQRTSTSSTLFLVLVAVLAVGGVALGAALVLFLVQLLWKAVETGL